MINVADVFYVLFPTLTRPSDTVSEGGLGGDKGEFRRHQSFSDAELAGCVGNRRFSTIYGPRSQFPHCDGQQPTTMRFPLDPRVGHRREAYDLAHSNHPNDGALEAR